MRKILVFVIATFIFFSFCGSTFASSEITETQAINKALKDSKLTRDKVNNLECEFENGKYEVEFTKKSNKAEYEYKIRKSRGKILKKEVDYVYNFNSSRKKIGKKAVRKRVAKFSKIKLSKIKRGTCTYKYDDNEGIYKVKFKTKNYKYKYEVLAPTGKIIEYSKTLR